MVGRKLSVIIILISAAVLQAGYVSISPQQFNDSVFRIFDNADPTKRVAFEVSGITTDNTRTYTWPDTDGGVQMNGDILDDLNTLGANSADSEFLVGTGAGALAWETGNMLRDSIGVGNSDSRQLTGLTLDTLTFDFSTQDYLFTNKDNTYLAIQGQTSSTGTSVELFSKDGDGTDTVQLLLYGVGSPSSYFNHEKLTFNHYNGAANIISQADGTGTIRPLNIYTGANTSQLILLTNNNITMSGGLAITGNLTASSFSGLYVTGVLAILSADGTVAAPGYTFTSDVDTGIWRSAADTLNISAAGSEVAEFDATEATFAVPISASTGSTFGTLTLADGSITDSGGTISLNDEDLSTTGDLKCTNVYLSEGFIHEGDTDTKLGFVLNTFYMTAGGEEMMRMASSKNSAVTFNLDTLNIDWQVSSDNISNFLKMDAGNDTFRVGDASNYTQIDATGVQTMAGSARVKLTVPLKAVAATAGPAAPTATTIGIYPVLQFSSAGPVESVLFVGHIPPHWDSTTDVTLHIHWAPTNGNAGDVVWDIDYVSLKPENNEVLTAATSNLTTTDSTQALQDEILETATLTIPAADMAVGDITSIKLSRDTADGADTYNSLVSFVLIHVVYTINKLGEAL